MCFPIAGHTDPVKCCIDQGLNPGQSLSLQADRKARVVSQEHQRACSMSTPGNNKPLFMNMGVSLVVGFFHPSGGAKNHPIYIYIYYIIYIRFLGQKPPPYLKTKKQKNRGSSSSGSLPWDFALRRFAACHGDLVPAGLARESSAASGSGRGTGIQSAWFHGRFLRVFFWAL